MSIGLAGIDVGNDQSVQAEMLDQRAKAMRMASANLHQRDVGTVKLREMLTDEKRHQHALRIAFHQDRSVREKQVAMGGPDVACDKLFCVLPEHRGEVDDRGKRHFTL